MQPPEDQDITVEFKLGDEKVQIPCLKKNYVDKKRDKDKIIGYVHRRNKEYTGKEYGTLKSELYQNIDIYSRKKVYQYIIAYVTTTDGEYIAVTRNMFLIILFLLAWLLGLGLGLLLTMLNQYHVNYSAPVVEDEVLPPDFSKAAAPENEDDDYDSYLGSTITLPQGTIEFDDDVISEEYDGQNTDENYTGKATIRITLLVDDEEHTILPETEVDIQNGALPNVYIDFTVLDLELKPGIYYGYIYIKYKDGVTDKKPLRIVILDSESGKVGIGYSDQLYVNLAEDKITLKYSCQEATANTIVQLIIQSGDTEILLAESGLIHSGDTISELPLDSSAKKRLRKGAYNGVMRVWFEDAATEDPQTTDIKADIEVTFNVQ